MTQIHSQNCPFPCDDHHHRLRHPSLDAPHSPSQMASRSIQLFCNSTLSGPTDAQADRWSRRQVSKNTAYTRYIEGCQLGGDHYAHTTHSYLPSGLPSIPRGNPTYAPTRQYHSRTLIRPSLDTLSERLGLDGIILALPQNRLQWYGHLVQKEYNDWLKECMEYEVEVPSQEVNQRKLGQRLWKKTVRHVN